MAEKRLIDAFAEIEAIKKYACKDCESYGGIRCRACWADDIMTWLADAPAVDAVEVVHGVWVGTADGYADGELVYDMWECSECGYDADGADEKPDWNYCPNCGADMRERSTDV